MGYLGFLCVGLGFGLMTGNVNIMLMSKTPLVPADRAMLLGGIMLGSGLLMIFVGAWKDVADRKERRLKRAAAIDQVERLAALWKQGALTDEEYAHQKRETLKLAEQEPAKLAGLPLSDPTVPETPAFAMIGRMSRLWESGALDDDEFGAFKRPYLASDAPQPTEREMEGLAHIERLADLWLGGTISDEEFNEQKKRYVRALGSTANQPELTEASRSKAPSSWDDLGEP
jgi:Short C-terminal domain